MPRISLARHTRGHSTTSLPARPNHHSHRQRRPHQHELLAGGLLAATGDWGLGIEARLAQETGGTAGFYLWEIIPKLEAEACPCCLCNKSAINQNSDPEGQCRSVQKEIIPFSNRGKVGTGFSARAEFSGRGFCARIGSEPLASFPQNKKILRRSNRNQDPGKTRLNVRGKRKMPKTTTAVSMLAERTVEGHTEEPADAVAAAAYVEPEDVAAQDFVEEKVIKG